MILPKFKTKKDTLNPFDKVHEIEFFESKFISSSLGVTVPMNIMTEFYLDHHYSDYQANLWIIAFEVLVGFYTYGYDRLNDALAYESNHIITLSEEKKNLYNEIILNKKLCTMILDYAFFFLAILIFESNMPILTDLCILGITSTTRYYRELKKNLKLFKPFYIGLMWSFATLVIPCMHIDQSLDILTEPYVLSPFLFMTAFSNIGDIKDIEEDISENLMTIPTQYGPEFSMALSIMGLIISIIIFNE